MTQHDLVWKQYLDWAQTFAEDLPDTADQAFRRYIKLKPEKTLEYLDFLLRHDQLEKALTLYVQLLEKDTPVGKTKFELHMELCEFIAKYPQRA